MANHSSILAWRIPWTEELQSMDSQSLTQLSNYHFHFFEMQIYNISFDWVAESFLKESGLIFGHRALNF